MNDEHSTHEPEPAASSAAEHDGATGHDAAPSDHGHGDDDHGGSTLGPVDVAAWGAGILGIIVALVIALAFVMATSGVG